MRSPLTSVLRRPLTTVLRRPLTSVLRRPLCLLQYGLCAGLLLSSCSDWDDHYDADTSLLASQHATLWQNIEQEGTLSQFATLVKRVGYDSILSASQTYTVWAPVNGSFDFEALSALDASRLTKEFVQNHIARNNYPVSGSVSQRLFTLNEKMMLFTSQTAGQQTASPYSIQGVALSQPNVASSNGTMHLLSGKIPFMENIYESLRAGDYAIDSVSTFFHSNDVRKLNEEKSVQGPPVDGVITYLDSVFDEHNELFQRYFAYINKEDSNYTMIVPTDQAWSKAKAHLRQYYHYVPTFEFMENTSTGSDKKLTTVNIKDVAYLQDSIVNRLLTSCLFFNNNLYDNGRLGALTTGERLQCDSLYGTTGLKVYADDAARLLEGATKVAKSNGAIWVTDSLRLRPWSVWNPELIIEAENSTTQASWSNIASDPQRVYVFAGSQNPAVTGHLSHNSYIELEPASMNSNPGIVFYLPNVRSTTYSIYIVMVPANITSANRATKPNQFDVSIGYADETGKNIDNYRNWTASKYFSNDSLQIDTLYLGDFTFPVSYAGTGQYAPYLRVGSHVLSGERDTYDRTLRIDCVILRPKELDDYLKAHPGYKYDTGLY